MFPSFTSMKYDLPSAVLNHGIQVLEELEELINYRIVAAYYKSVIEALFYQAYICPWLRENFNVEQI